MNNAHLSLWKRSDFLPSMKPSDLIGHAYDCMKEAAHV